MKIWLASVWISCLLLVGCGASSPKTMEEDQLYKGLDTKEVVVSPTPLGHQVPPFMNDKIVMSNPSVPTTSSAPIAASSVPEPAPKPSERSVDSASAPTDKPKAKLRQPEASKKPTVPVTQSQKIKRSAQRSLSLSELASKYPESFKLRGASNENKVALTFDDGPDVRFTPAILDILKENGVKATFFVLGKRASDNPELIKRMAREGHIVGNHSYDHASLPKLPVSRFQEEIESTQRILENLIGYAPKLIRPPYGAINEEQVKWVSEHHYMIVNWNVDSLDWKQLSSEQVLSNIIGHTGPGSIILQHSGGGDKQDLSGTVKALPAIINKLKANGYDLVTVPELLHIPKSK
jgi:peptidoglycan/xylan/chitin deacetylase (PgdA/CDA1 family)